jgi:hypothetical protein
MNNNIALVTACRLRLALEQISSQAVCVNMDGDDGNERMLKDVLQIADDTLDTTKPAFSELAGTVTNDIDLIVVCCQMLTALRTLLTLDELKLRDIDSEPAPLKRAIAQAQAAIAAGKAALVTVAATAAKFAST